MKYIKTILLIAGLIASLSSTSYATKKPETVENHNGIIRINLEESETEQNEILYDKKTEVEKFEKLLKFYQEIWDSEKTIRDDMLNKLKKLKIFFPKWNHFKDHNFDYNLKKIQKNMNISSLDFNLFQSILLDYYKFSILFNKYNIFISLLLNSKKSIQQTQQYKTFMDGYIKFKNNLKPLLKLIRNICESFLPSTLESSKTSQQNKQNTPSEEDQKSDDDSDDEDDDIYNYDNPDKGNIDNKKILNETSDTILALESKFQKIFNMLKIAIPAKTIYKNTFQPDTDINNLVDENTSISDIEIIPKQNENDKSCKLSMFGQNKVPPHYKINPHILATIVKMELIKSLNYLKQFNNYHANHSSQNEDIAQYNKIKQYANKLCLFYNNLKFFMIYCDLTRISNYSQPKKMKKKLDIFEKLFSLKPTNKLNFEQAYNKKIESYIKTQNVYNDMLYSSTSGLKLLPNYKNLNTFRTYYSNIHKVSNIYQLYNHINKNIEKYQNLMHNQSLDKIAPIEALDEFFINLDDANNRYFNKFYQAMKDQQNNIETLKPFENIKYIQNDQVNSNPDLTEKNPDLTEKNPDLTEKNLNLSGPFIIKKVDKLSNIFNQINQQNINIKSDQKEKNLDLTEKNLNLSGPSIIKKVDKLSNIFSQINQQNININSDQKEQLSYGDKKNLDMESFTYFKNMLLSQSEMNKTMSNNDKKNLNIKLFNYFKQVWDSKPEQNKRIDIINKLQKLKNIFQYWNNNKKMNWFYDETYWMYKNMDVSNLNFNLLQSILLDYYKFAISFNKYNIFVLFSSRNPDMTSLDMYKNFIETYNQFMAQIKTGMTLIKNISEKFFLNQSLDPKEFKNDNPNESVTLTENQEIFNKKILNETADTILKLESKFQKIFKLLDINIPTYSLWYKVIGNNDIDALIDENTDISNLEIMPKQDEDNRYTMVNLYKQNEIPPHYKVNLNILGTIVKMELIKSLSYLKQLSFESQNNNLNDYSQNSIIHQNTKYYDTLKKYVNKLYCFYNNLRAYMVYYTRSPKSCYSFEQKVSTKDVKLFKKKFYPDIGNNWDEKAYNKTLKRYIHFQIKTHDLLYTSLDKINTLSNPHESTRSNIFYLYYIHRHYIHNTYELYKHIIDNEKIYNDLINDVNSNDKIAPIKAFDKFFINLDNPDARYFYKFYEEMINQQNNNSETLNPFENSKNLNDTFDPLSQQDKNIQLSQKEENIMSSDKWSLFNNDNKSFDYFNMLIDSIDEQNNIPKNVLLNQTQAKITKKLHSSRQSNSDYDNNLNLQKNQNDSSCSNNQNMINQQNILNYSGQEPNQIENTYNSPNKGHSNDIIFNIHQLNILNNQPNQTNTNIKNKSNTPSSNNSDNNILNHKTKRRKN